MRRWVLSMAFGLAGCSLTGPPPQSNVSITDWRTATGEPLTAAEFTALRNSCAPRTGEVAIDPRSTVSSPDAANPAFRPGGLGWMNSTPTGLASTNAAITVGATRVERGPRIPLEECLESKGLVHAP